jgi:hypothetical protein
MPMFIFRKWLLHIDQSRCFDIEDFQLIKIKKAKIYFRPLFLI